MEIQITIHQTDEPIALMRIIGDINASNFLDVVNRAREIYNNPVRNLIIDLSEVPSISTTGIVALHKIALVYSGVPQAAELDGATVERRTDFTHSSNARKYVKLLNPQPDVDKALEKAGMKLFFKTFRDLDSALQSF